MQWNNARAIPTIAVTDLNEGKRFYTQTVGLQEGKTPEAQQDSHVYLRCGESDICLYERPEPAGSKATVAALEVQDVEKAVKDLQASGVRFEDYDIPEMGIKTKNGIAQMGDFRSAWFKDPWGNVIGIDNGLSLTQRAGVAKAQTR